MARQGIMLCYPFDEKRLAKWQPPHIVQPKLDGDRCRAFIDVEGEVVLLTSEGNVIHSVPHINQDLKKLGISDVELDGELYIHGTPHQELHGIVSRKSNTHPHWGEVTYQIFDLISDEKQQARLHVITQLKSEMVRTKSLNLVPSYLCSDTDEIMRCLKTFIDSGYEGIIVRRWNSFYVRRRSTSIMKFKPKCSNVYIVIGYKEEYDIHGYAKGRLGALVCRSTDGEHFSVGTGFDAYTREELWKQRDTLIGAKILIAYQNLTSGRRVPRFPVFMSIQ